eukprot:3722499-Pyramimonas_sp.AAC.1
MEAWNNNSQAKTNSGRCPAPLASFQFLSVNFQFLSVNFRPERNILSRCARGWLAPRVYSLSMRARLASAPGIFSLDCARLELV